MEVLLLLIILVFVIVITRKLSNNKQSLQELEENFKYLKKQIEQLKFQPAEKIAEKPSLPDLLAPLPNTGPVIEPAPPKIINFGDEDIAEKSEDPVFEKAHSPIPGKVIEPVKPTDPIEPTPVSKPGWFKNWLTENPDIEKFIGENLVNKIGIAVLVLGIAFFVKYAIDQEWINKVGRVCIGLFCGIVLTGLAHRLRKNYHSFSSVLVGGGLTVFYFTIAFAYHQYQLLSQEKSFIIMVIITIFAVLLSILYDRIELGILATVGGFITPFLVSHGDGNYIVLFTYAAILNAGLIFLAYYKRWRILNFLAFFFTEIIYLGWVIGKSGLPDFPYRGTFIFGAIFYLMFVVMNVIHHVSRGSKLKAFDFIILLSVNLAFYASGLYLIQSLGEGMYKGLFTAALGVFNLILAYLFFRQSKADKNFIYLLIGITLSFISLAAPVQLKGHFITLFWSAEIVILLWLYQKSLIPLLKIAFLLISCLMLVSLLMDWSEVYFQDTAILPVIFNKGWVTGFVSALAMFLVYRLLRKDAGANFLWKMTNADIASVYLAGSIGLVFFGGALEINDQFVKRLPGTAIQFIYLQAYLVIFPLVLFVLLQKFAVNFNQNLRLISSLLIFIVYAFNITHIYFAETQMLTSGNYKNYFLINWPGALLLLLLGWNTIQFIRKNKTVFLKALPFLSWVIALALLVIISVEIEHLFLWLNYSNAESIVHTENIYFKAGLTIVWAVFSFIMIWLGMSNSYKTLRIIALVVFGITLIKLFAFDIRNIAPAGKIIAFILLGVLLLIISFMYQRLKKIIIDNASNPK